METGLLRVIRSPFAAMKQRARAAVAFSLFCGLSLATHAQIGSGWTPTTEGYYIQTSANCTAVPSGSGLGGTFSVPAGSLGRAEFRFEDLATTGSEQFQGFLTVNSLGGDKVNVKQLFGPAPSTPFVIIAVQKANGGELYEVEGGNKLASYTVGARVQINTVYTPNVSVAVYINGTLAETKTGNGPPNYNKFGAYISSSGTGPCTTTWDSVQMWTKGQTGGYYVTDVSDPNGTISPTTGWVGPLAAGASATVTFSPNSGYSADVYVDNVLTVPTTPTSYVFTNLQQCHMIYVAFTQGAVQVAAPTFSPAAGIYTSAPSVAISTTTGGASINYTTDGSTPNESHGLSYSAPVILRTTATLKAIAFGGGYADSPVGTATYTVSAPIPTELRLRGSNGDQLAPDP